MKKNILFIIIAIVIVLIAIFIFWNQVIKGGVMLVEEDTSLEDVTKKGKLVVGVSAGYPPMMYKEGDEIIGFDMDLIKKVAEKLKVELEIHDMNWPDFFPKVKSKELDVTITATTITPERQETVLFTIPYFTSGQVIIVREGDDSIKGPEDFKGKIIAAMRDTTCEEVVEEYIPEATLYESLEEEVEALKAGEVDAVVHDYSASAFMAKNDSKIKVVGNPFTQEFYGIMSNIKNETLVAEIDSILRELKRSGELGKIGTKWFGR